MYDSYPRQTWVEVDLAQFRRNIEALRAKCAGARALLVVKANAYGHGIVEVSRFAETLGIDYLGVANVSEALLLRAGGVSVPVLAMGYVAEEEMEVAAANAVDIFSWTPDHLRAFHHAALRNGTRGRVHLKVDIGMGRLGAPPSDILAAAAVARTLPGLEVVGLATHFPKADTVDDPDTAQQMAAFRNLAAALDQQGLRPPIVHCANSPAALRFDSKGFDMVRLGIAAYGLCPDRDVPLLPGMGPVLSWKARLGPVRKFAAGTPLSYGGEYRTTGEETIAVAPFGYADGFRRYPKAVNTVLVGGRETRVVGRVCMDQCLVRIEGLSDARTGMEATIIGTQGAGSLSADTLAGRWGTNSYDVICGINVRVPRVYLEG